MQSARPSLRADCLIDPMNEFSGFSNAFGRSAYMHPIANASAIAAMDKENDNICRYAILGRIVCTEIIPYSISQVMNKRNNMQKVYNAHKPCVLICTGYHVFKSYIARSILSFVILPYRQIPFNAFISYICHCKKRSGYPIIVTVK